MHHSPNRLMYRDLEQTHRHTFKGKWRWTHVQVNKGQLCFVGVSDDSQSGVSDALAGDVSLNLGLVDPIDADPHKDPPNGYRPKGVSPQGVHVKTGEREGSVHYRMRFKLKALQKQMHFSDTLTPTS